MGGAGLRLLVVSHQFSVFVFDFLCPRKARKTRKLLVFSCWFSNLGFCSGGSELGLRFWLVFGGERAVLILCYVGIGMQGDNWASWDGVRLGGSFCVVRKWFGCVLAEATTN